MHDIEQYKKLFVELDLAELNIKDGDFEITMKAKQEPGLPMTMPMQAAAAPLTPASNQEEEVTGGNDYFKVESPLLGVFYAGESPSSKPYVSVGDHVKKGDILCTIEAMKMFNDVKSTVDGVVREILVNDGDLVEFKTPIFAIEVEA